MIEDLLRHGLAAKAILREGAINYSDFTRRVDSILDDAKSEEQMKTNPDRLTPSLKQTTNQE